MTVVSRLNSSAIAVIPAWVRARALAVYLLAFFGGIAAGSVLWGEVANRLGTPLALTISVMELGFQYQHLITTTAQPVPISVGIVACYLLLALTAGWLFSLLEYHVAMKR